jgi:two-component system sensor histidine kinase UhpB
MSFRHRIHGLITLLMALFIMALLVLEVDASRNSIREEMESSTRITVQLLGTFLQQAAYSGNPISPGLVVNFLEHTGRVRAHDVKVVNLSGETLYQSPPFKYRAGEYAPQWYSKLVSPQVIPINIRYPGGTLIVNPEPSRSVLDAWDEMTRVLLLSLAFFVLANLVVYFMVERALVPLSDLVQGLEQMEQRQYHTRLPSWPMPEMAAISNSFNRMAQAVEESFQIRARAELTAEELRHSREISALIQNRLEQERRRLARELHDELGQSMTAVSTVAASIAHACDGREAEMAQRARTIMSICREMSDATHALVRQLRPLALDNLGLVAALTDLVETHGRRNPNQHIATNIAPDLDDLPEEIAITAYRLVQECLTNAQRHSAASELNIEIHKRHEPAPSLEILIRDNGVGTDLSLIKDERFGLLGMRERVQGQGGEFLIRTAPGAGFSLNASLPLGAQHG